MKRGGMRKSATTPKRIHLGWTLAIFSCLLLAQPGASVAAELEVTVERIANDAGYVLVALCTPDTFLGVGCPYTGRARAANGKVQVVVSDIEPGVYALQAFHDSNDNMDLDRNIFGLPKEGMGFGNDAQMRFGPPRFEEAAIEVPPRGAVARLRLRYFD
jgi:uncharacterized protein (DUF2141 family)